MLFYRMSKTDDRLQYRAWCPDNVQPHEEKEFLEVDLGQQSFVKLIITKGLSTADKVRPNSQPELCSYPPGSHNCTRR